jgi:hypothetical protein
MKIASAPVHGLRKIGGEGEPSRLDVLLEKRVEARLVDRDLALLQHLDLLGVLVHADDLVSEVREADARDEPDVAGADHRNLHGSGPRY